MSGLTTEAGNRPTPEVEALLARLRTVEAEREEWCAEAQNQFLLARAAEARVEALSEALSEFGNVNWSGSPEVEEFGAWVRSRARSAFEASSLAARAALAVSGNQP